MKLLFVVSSLTPGGAEKVCSFLANRWCSSHEVVLVTLKNRKDFYPLESSIKRYYLGIDRKRWFYLFPTIILVWKLRKLIIKEKPDYIISFVVKTNIFTLLSTIGLKFPVIVTEHSTIINKTVDKKQHFFRNILYHHSHKITVLSDTIKHELIESYPKIDPKKIEVVPNPLIRLQESYFSNLEKKEKTIITVSRLVPSKRIDLLVRAFKILVSKNPDFRLKIVGDGPDRSFIEKLIHEQGLAQYVEILGFIKEVHYYLSKASIFVFTSEYEGFGLVLLEAMEASLPIVAFDVPGVRDIIQSGINGILVPFGDTLTLANTMHMLIQDEELQKKLIKEGKKTLKKYSPKNIDNIWFKKVLID